MTQSFGIPSPVSTAMIERLVAFDTTSAKSNLALIDYAANILDDLGATCRLTYDRDGAKANLFATLGPGDLPGIVLSGHTDVVPAAAKDWTSDPFQVVSRDGRLYGRGTADMKSFIAVCLAKAPDIARRRLGIPIHFAFSYDEEVGCLGVRNLLADLAHLPTRPRLCVVGEPTEMRVVVAHKGKKSVRCTVHGKECHSAMNDRGVNAVEVAAEIVAFLRALQRRIRHDGPFEEGFDPPYTTIHTGLIRGGVALNIVPKTCMFEFEIRNLPRHDPDQLMAEVRGLAQDLIPDMLAVDPAAGIDFDESNTTVGLDSVGNEEAARLASALTGRNDTAKVAFTTEAGLFSAAGIPAVVCGPGSIDQAHKPDEFITLDQVAQCEAFIDHLVDGASVAGSDHR